MGINKETDVAATLLVGPTSMGMVRIYVEAEGVEIPMDFEPDEALEIAEEIRAAAESARSGGGGGRKPRDGRPDADGPRPKRPR
jgi:hypothetical protein